MGYGNSSIRRRSNRLDGEASGGASVDTAALECSLDELREFLEADLIDVRADPDFEERLRRRLWDLVLARSSRNQKREDQG